MGCRPSKHATSKIRDAHARGANQCTCMYSPRKYNKKHKCNSNGTGSRRTSGGTQSGSHGHSSTGHRSRSHKSDDNEFPVFSTTTAVYRRSASKASKITLRLSSDGSTLEIEQCDYNIAKSETGVKRTSRPWNSTPNLSKIGNKGSPMFQNIDLRPSASVWTNTSASRSTPGSAHPNGTWRAALLAERVKKNEGQIDMDGSGMVKMDIRETILLNDEVRDEDMTEASLVNEHTYDFKKYGHTFSVHGQDKGASNQSSRSMVYPMTIQPEGNSQLPCQQDNRESVHYAVSSSSSPNHNLNFYCLSQLGESFSNSAEMVPKMQHRDKCTASLKNYEAWRSEDTDVTDVGRIRTSKNDNISNNNYNNCSLKKYNQRYSIPRYDCFRVPDHNVYNQSTSAVFESSNQQQNVLSGNNERCKWLNEWQKNTITPHRRSHFDSPTWNEKLTDREKLVLNLSTRPHSVSNNGVELTALVGRRDENWHSNNNLISGQNGDQPFESTVLNSPVESDTVLTFVELGCPVSYPDSQFNPEMDSPLSFYSPVHVPTCSNQCNVTLDEIPPDNQLAEENDVIVNQNNSHIFESSCTFKQLTLKDDGISRNTFAGKNFKKQTISDACSADRPQFLARKKCIASPESLIKKIDSSTINANSGIYRIDFDSCSESIQIRRETETRTSSIQQDRQILEISNRKDFNSFAITPLTRINTNTSEHENRIMQACNENSFVWRGSMRVERGANLGNPHTRNTDENGNFNVNEKRRSLGSEIIRNQTDRGNGYKIGIKGTNEEGLLNILKNQKNFSSDNEEHEENRETRLNSPDFFYEDVSSQCVDNYVYGPSRPRTYSLPLLCYNNSFGERFQDSKLRENNSNNQRISAINYSGPASSLKPVREKVGYTRETFNLYHDIIDINNFHHLSQSPGRESKGISPSVIESTPSFHGTMEMKGEIDFWPDSGNFPPEVQTFIDVNYSVNRDGTCSQNQDVIIAGPDSHIATREISLENYTDSCPKDANGLMVNTEPIKNYSNLPTFVSGHHEGDYDPEKSITSDKTAWKTNRDDVYFHGLFPDSTAMSVPRSPVPLGILQARIIGRNISAFANACFYFDHNDIPSFLLTPVTTTPTTTCNIIDRMRTEDNNTNKKWMPLRKADSVASSISELANKNNSSEVNLITKSKLHSKYALTQAKLTENMEKTPFSSIPLQLPNDDKAISSALPITFSCQTLDSTRSTEHVHSSTFENESQLPVICSSPSSSITCIPDSECSQIHLPEAFTSSSSTHSSTSTGEFTSQEDDATSQTPCNSSNLTVRPMTNSSNEPYPLINTQLSSSHSSDSLSCSLSIYSLANTLHSDTSHSDTGHDDAPHSDISHSDTARYDFPPSDSSHSDNLEVICSQHLTFQSNEQQSNDTSQSEFIQACTHQSILSQPDSHLSNTHQSNCTRSNTPSSFPSSQSTHSPRSSPVSTISHHSSPSSQSTLSPHSSSPSSPSHQSFHDATESLQDELPQSYSTPPESVTSLHNPSFFFPLTSYSSSPPPLDTHDTEDSGLSILTQSSSCRSTSTENPKSYQNQRIIDLDDRPGLNHDEIQRSLPSAPCDCSEDHPIKWDTTISGETWRKFQITSPFRLRWQNGHSYNNRSALSDQETVWDSKCIEQEEGDGKTTSKRDYGKNHDRTCDVEHERPIVEVQKVEPNNTNDEINVYACDQNSYNFHTDELIMPSVLPYSFIRQSSNIMFDTTHFNSNCIRNDDLEKDRYFHLYANDPSNNEDETFSPKDLGDGQITEESLVYQYIPAVDHESDCKDLVHDCAFQNCSHFKGDNDIINSPLSPIVKRKVENCECSGKNTKDIIAERLDGRITDTNEVEQNVNCQSEEISRDKNNSEFIINNVKCSEAVEGYSFSEVKSMEDSSVFFAEKDINTRINKDCMAGGNPKMWKLISSSNPDSECLERSFDITEKQTAADDKSFYVDDFLDQSNQKEFIYPAELNSSYFGKLTLERDKQCGIMTGTTGLSNQIGTEITKQVSDDNKHAIAVDTNIANLSAGTDTSPTGQNQNGGIDLTSCTNATSLEYEQIAENKTERPKSSKRNRKVQSLVQHFESVSMRGQAETQAQEKF